ncbi:hypothetical protein E2C01_043732 [Portunus trituberculatus]|uniref:Uncharacterized protein n=1 Tax=Portunus trituberculatus TaxID=210409 RepID=A0A5B7FWW7_PORTR|nr:hypothetical protein [Portunus trituberculatus]
MGGDVVVGVLGVLGGGRRARWQRLRLVGWGVEGREGVQEAGKCCRREPLHRPLLQYSVRGRQPPQAASSPVLGRLPNCSCRACSPDMTRAYEERLRRVLLRGSWLYVSREHSVCLLRGSARVPCLASRVTGQRHEPVPDSCEGEAVPRPLPRPPSPRPHPVSVTLPHPGRLTLSGFLTRPCQEPSPRRVCRSS